MYVHSNVIINEGANYVCAHTQCDINSLTLALYVDN